MTFLSTLPCVCTGRAVPWVFGIANALGQMAGAIGNVAFFYNGQTTSVSLGTFSGGQISNAYALTDNGVIVGNSSVGKVSTP